jgi:hypothetical protein
MKKATRFHKRKLFQQLLGGFALSLIVISIATLSITSASLAAQSGGTNTTTSREHYLWGLNFASEGID